MVTQFSFAGLMPFEGALYELDVFQPSLFTLKV